MVVLAHPALDRKIRASSPTWELQRCTGGDATEQLQEAEDIQGRRVLTAYAHVAPLGIKLAP